VIPDHFATSGFAARRSANVKLTRFQVLGERSSGTNFLRRLIGRNTDLVPDEALGWKHGFPNNDPIPEDLAVICVVRNAGPWALSMFARPWHTTAQMQSLPFDDFLRAPWDTISDRPRYFQGLPGIRRGAPLQQDRHPDTGAQFENMFALRRAKLESLTGYLERDCSCTLIRLEDVQKDPQAAVTSIAEALETRRRTKFRPVVKRLGTRFKPADGLERPPIPDTLSSGQMNFMRRWLDLKAEARLGYVYTA